MKKYREMAAESAKEKLSHYGATYKENAPESLKERGSNIERMKEGRTRGFKRGGAVVAMDGAKAKPRADKKPHRADGGRVKGNKGRTTVNVIVASPQGQQQPPQAIPVPVPVAPGAPPPGGLPPGIPPRPPIAGPPMLPPGVGGMAGGPPMLPPRKSGGRVMTAGAGSGEGRIQKTERTGKANFDGVANRI